MKDIIAILRESGIEIAEEKTTDLRKAVAENYKTINEFTKKIDKYEEQLSTANDTITDLESKLQNAEKVDVEALQQKIADYEQAEQTRKQEETAAKELQAIKERFTGLNGKYKYINEYTENAVFDEFKNALSLEENKGKSDNEIYAAITKDKNIYENPNPRLIIPPVGNINSKGNSAYMEQFYADNSISTRHSRVKFRVKFLLFCVKTLFLNAK